MWLTILEVLAALAVLFAVASAMTRDRDVLQEALPDDPDLDLPIGAMQPEDVSALRFSMVLRGYRMGEVDEVLARLGRDLAARDERILALEQALVDLVEPQVAAAEAAAATAAPATAAPSLESAGSPVAPAAPGQDTSEGLEGEEPVLLEPAAAAEDRAPLLVEPVLEEPVTAPPSATPPAAEPARPDVSEAGRAPARSGSDNGVERDEVEDRRDQDEPAGADLRTAGVDPAPDPAPAPPTPAAATAGPDRPQAGTASGPGIDVDDLPRTVTLATASPTALPDLSGSAVAATPGPGSPQGAAAPDELPGSAEAGAAAGTDSAGEGAGEQQGERHWPQPAAEPETEPLVPTDLDGERSAPGQPTSAATAQGSAPGQQTGQVAAEERTAPDDAGSADEAFPEVQPADDERR